MTLENSIRWGYSNYDYIPTRRWYNERYVPCDTAYIEIPITFPVFEMPVFAFSHFDFALENYSDQEAVVVKLFKGKFISRYSTVSRVMQDVLISSYKAYALVPVQVKQGDEEIYYFATQGAVFDKHLNALAICSWLVEMFEDNVDGGWSFKLVRPILRVSPQCYINKSNPMEKLIANKMISSILTGDVVTPATHYVDTSSCINKAKVEICDSPFHIKKPDVPSISTTTDKLTLTAAQYINEVI